MKCDRLSSLALLHIHYDFQHDNEQILKEFATLHPRRMELEDLIFPPSQDDSCDGLVIRRSVVCTLVIYKTTVQEPTMEF